MWSGDGIQYPATTALGYTVAVRMHASITFEAMPNFFLKKGNARSSETYMKHMYNAITALRLHLYHHVHWPDELYHEHFLPTAARVLRNHSRN